MPATPLPLGNFAAELIRVDLPVAILDACAILDILRSPFRNKGEANAFAGFKLAGLTTSKYTIVLPSLVGQEFGRNAPKVRLDLRKAVEGINESVERVNHVLNALGCLPLPLSITAKPLFSVESLLARVDQVCGQMFSTALVVEEDGDTRSLATDRVCAAEPILPARLGKDSLVDCVVLEEALALGRLARASGFVRPIALISPNTDDFEHDAIEAELELVGINYCANLVHGLAVLDGSAPSKFKRP